MQHWVRFISFANSRHSSQKTERMLNDLERKRGRSRNPRGPPGRPKAKASPSRTTEMRKNKEKAAVAKVTRVIAKAKSAKSMDDTRNLRLHDVIRRGRYQKVLSREPKTEAYATIFSGTSALVSVLAGAGMSAPDLALTGLFTYTSASSTDWHDQSLVDVWL